MCLDGRFGDTEFVGDLLVEKAFAKHGENTGLVLMLAVLVLGFSLVSPRFLTGANLGSMGFQLPLLGLLTLAMLAPILSGGLNLAIVYTANICGLTLAWTIMKFGGAEAGIHIFILGCVAAVIGGALAGAMMGAVVAYVGAHPILVSLAMMIFLRGLGEFLTRGGDISGFPDYMRVLGHGSLIGIPVPLILFAVIALAWHVLLRRTPHGFSVYMTGSNMRAAECSTSAVRRMEVMGWSPVGPTFGDNRRNGKEQWQDRQG